MAQKLYTLRHNDCFRIAARYKTVFSRTAFCLETDPGLIAAFRSFMYHPQSRAVAAASPNHPKETGMASLEELRSQLSEIGSPQMQADGYALWLTWLGELNPTVVQTLEEYGGIQVASASGQSLWFYFSTDILLAAARIGVWARFNPLAVTMQIFPSRFRVDHIGAKGMIFDESIWHQSFDVPVEFRMLVHAGMSQAVSVAPGLSLGEKPLQKGMSEEIWSHLSVDTRLPYQSTLGWYALLRPVGNPLDKAYQQGWREFFSQVESVLQRNKFRFTVQDSFVMFPLDTLRQFKSWCRDFLALVNRLKSEAPAQYWPCVTTVVGRKGLNLNEELPKKLNVEWEQLTPDFPHMSMRNALMLGNEFSFHEVRFAPSRQSPDDWCSLSLREENAAKTGALPQMSPTNLLVGNHPHCFYCGQRSHLTAACPSRVMDERDPQVWPTVAHMTFTDMRLAVNAIDEQIAAAGEEKDAAVAALARDPSPGGVFLRAFFDINWPVQLRALPFFWRARTKDFHKAASELAEQDSNPVWDQLASFAHKDPHDSEKELGKLSVRFPKDFRLMSLRGFAAMELGDTNKALNFWREAEVYSPFPVMQAWHAFLQARLLEFSGRFAQAMDLYDQVVRTCPSWHDALYRRLVCEIKSGFSERALGGLASLVDRNGNYFNRALIDPEMDRGHIQVFACLYGLWASMEARVKEEENNLRRLTGELEAWFTPGHAFAAALHERIGQLLQLSSIANYVPRQKVSSGRLQLERDLQMFVAQEGKNLRVRFKSYAESLRTIHDEAAWFPFPGALVDFNRSYNMGVNNMNWALVASLQSPEAFKKALGMADEEAQRIEKLESRMKFLRIVRDATLFLLSMAESFFWLELIGIIAVFVILPLLLIYGDKIGLSWTVGAISKERWQVQKALLLVVTVLALGVAGLRTLVRFEHIREKIFAKAKAGELKKKPKKKK